MGIIAAGAGGYVAFERSNQLGSAVLLVIGAVFLIVGIQGTRLMRFTSGSKHRGAGAKEAYYCRCY